MKISLTILITILICLFFSCKSNFNSKHTTKEVKSSTLEIENEEISVDTSKLRILKSYYTKQFQSSDTIKWEVAVEVEVLDTSLIGKIYIQEGGYIYHLIAQDNQGYISSCQDCYWTGDSNYLGSKAILTGSLLDTTKTINIITGSNSDSIKLWNKRPIKLNKGKLPYRPEDYYKSQIIFEELRGHLVEDITENSFVVQQFDYTGNQYDLIQIKLDGENLGFKKTPHRKFDSFSFNDNFWVAKYWKRNKANKDEIEWYLITGPKSTLDDLNEIEPKRIYGEGGHASIIFDDEIYFFDSRKAYQVVNDTIQIDSSLIQFINNIDSFELNYNKKLKKIEYEKNLFGLRCGEYIIERKLNQWNIVHEIDSLANRFDSSTSIDDNGFYFIANRRAYYSNYKQTIEILSAYDNLMSVKRGGDDYLIFELGNDMKEIVGLIYEIDSKNEHPIYTYKMHISMESYLFRFIKYREKNESIIVLTPLGLHEIKIEDIIKSDER